MVGMSFGGYWTARMAAADDRLACAIACGAPTHRSFQGGLGTPEVIGALSDITGATCPIDLRHNHDGPVGVVQGCHGYATEQDLPRGRTSARPDDQHGCIALIGACDKCAGCGTSVKPVTAVDTQPEDFPAARLWRAG